MNEKLDYKFGKYDLDFLIKLKAHEFRKQKIDNKIGRASCRERV